MGSTRLFAAVVAVAVAGIAVGKETEVGPWPRASIDVRKAPDAPVSPKRVFVVTDILGTLDRHPESVAFGMELEKAIEVRLDAQLRRCGVAVAGYATVGLDREEDVARQRASFQPDAVLVVRRLDRSQIEEPVILFRAVLELWDVALEAAPGVGEIRGKAWWRAKLVFRADNRGARRVGLATRSADAFVDDVVDRLKADGFFPGCPLAKPSELPSLAGPVASSRRAPITTLHVSGGLTVTTFADPAARAAARAAESDASALRGAGRTEDVEPLPKGPSSDQLRGPIWGAGRTQYAPDLETYFKAGITAELERMGVTTSDPRRALSGEIEDASADYSRWGFGCTVRVRFELKDSSTGQVIYSASKTGASADRTVTEAGAFDQALARCVEELARDPDFARAIQ